LSIVLDASVFFAWQFADEETEPVSEVVAKVLDRGAIVPVHWCAEVANGFAMAVRRGRMSARYRDGALSRVPDLPIEVDAVSASAFLFETQQVCDRQGLTAYDAAYVELAARRNLPLATLDKALQRAAEAEGVSIMSHN